MPTNNPRKGPNLRYRIRSHPHILVSDEALKAMPWLWEKVEPDPEAPDFEIEIEHVYTRMVPVREQPRSERPACSPRGAVDQYGEPLKGVCPTCGQLH